MMKLNKFAQMRTSRGPVFARGGLLCAGLLAGALALPTAAEACGGLFCDSVTPVTQSAERIVFVRDGATMHMVVRLTYQGPPIDFGWLLPVPPDVTTRIGSVALFNDLDQVLGPRFVLNTEIDPACAVSQFNGDAASAVDAAFSDGGAGGPDVQILAREQVGPYDQVVLQAASVADLQTWLTENGYQFPEGSEPLLQTYLEAGAAFLALKLVADADDTDVVPLHLSFTSDTPAIPLRPTAVAAQPDMGILVHLWGASRAVPINFNHVQINEAAIDWQAGGANYTDVVSQAADEAGGRAFVTDAALVNPSISARVIGQGQLRDLRAATTLGAVLGALLGAQADTDVTRVLAHHITPPDDIAPVDYLACLGCFGDDWQSLPVDGEALATEIEADVAASRDLLDPLFERQPFVTRLFTTMSAAEMNEDPIFDFNRDLPEVSPQRTATQYIACDADGQPDFANAVIITADGQSTGTGQNAPAFIQRQNGLTVRGEDTRAAAVVERMFAAGQPEPISVFSPDAGPGSTPSGALGGDGDDGGCTCDVAATDGGSPLPGGLFAGLMLILGLKRRRTR
jgi:MYXO-CTERM domain-containing protein